MDRGNGGVVTNLKRNLEFLQEKITKRQAYLGIISAVAIYFMSLFFSWSEARDSSSVSDAGFSSGWSEAGFIALLPIGFMAYRVLRSKTLSAQSILLLGAVAVALLFLINVLGRTEWIYHPSADAIIYANAHTENHGSNLGLGFWIALLALISAEICGLAWAFHMETDAGSA